jgi:hypothetical protein
MLTSIREPLQDAAMPSEASSFTGEIENPSSIQLALEPWRWRKAVLAADLTAGTKVAAIALLEFVNRKDGRAFASEETIAKACGMTERGVRAAIAALKVAGFIRVVRRGRMQSNLVYLSLPVTGMAVTVNDTVTGMDLQSDRHDHDKVTGMTMPPNLRREPKTEPQRESPRSRSIDQIQSDDGSAIGDGKNGRARSADRRTEFPDGFVLNDKLITIAHEKGFSPDRAKKMFERFEGNHRAKGSQFADWSYAWRNWVVDQVEIDAKSNTRAETDRNYIDGRL